MGSDNRLELDAQICLNGKKKSPGKRIIGFEVFILMTSRGLLSMSI